MKLKKEHLIPYLPYSLKVIMENKKTNVAWMSTKQIAVIRPNGIGEYKKIKWKFAHLNIKPILRPLSDNSIIQNILDKYYLELGYKLTYTSGHKFLVLGIKKGLPDVQFAYQDYLMFFKNHLDVFGLIEKGLAIDIKTLK